LLIKISLDINSINSLIQPSVRHLIVERRLNDEREISIIARQFPNVKYLELLFPLDKSLFVGCLKSLFSFGDKKETRNYWPELINFCTCVSFPQFEFIWDDNNLHLWFIRNTDLKYHSVVFYANHSRSMFSIWF